MAERLVLQFYHLFHVSTVNLLFVAVSVLVRNHSRFIIGLWLTIRHDCPTIVGVHNIVRTRTGAQGKSQHTGRDNGGSLFHILLLKAIYAR